MIGFAHVAVLLPAVETVLCIARFVVVIRGILDLGVRFAARHQYCQYADPVKDRHITAVVNINNNKKRRAFAPLFLCSIIPFLIACHNRYKIHRLMHYLHHNLRKQAPQPQKLRCLQYPHPQP